MQPHHEVRAAMNHGGAMRTPSCVHAVRGATSPGHADRHGDPCLGSPEHAVLAEHQVNKREEPLEQVVDEDRIVHFGLRGL